MFEGKILEKYSAKKIITKSTTPKVLPLAPCLYYLAILDEYKNEELGGGLELTVGVQLVRTDESLYYWREGNDEVDFVLKKGRKLYAIEVKSGRKNNRKVFRNSKKNFRKQNLL